MIQFYHNTGIYMLKLGCTLPNLANICLHKSTNYKFYAFCESDKDLCEKIREDMTGGPSIVFTRKAVVEETYIRNSSNVCKSIVGIDASQLYPFSIYLKICQQDCTRDGSLTLKCRNSRLDIMELATLRIWSCPSIKNQDQNVKLKAFYIWKTEKN